MVHQDTKQNRQSKTDKQTNRQSKKDGAACRVVTTIAAPRHNNKKQKTKVQKYRKENMYIKKEMNKGGSEDGRGSKIHFGHD